MKKYILLIFFISLVATCLLYTGKGFFATGEEGIPLLNPQRTLSVYSSVWYETGTGYPLPVNLPRTTFFALAIILNHIFSDWIVQRIIFFLLIFTGQFSMFLLARRIVGKDNETAVIAGLFYYFNLYVMSQIWQRFLYTDIFAWAYLPLFLLLVMLYFQKGSLRYLTLLLLSSLLFSDSFGQPALVLTFLVPFLIFIFLSYDLSHDEKKSVKKFFSRCAIFSISFIVVNFWWIYPYATLGSVSFSLVSDWRDNIASLQGVSQYFPTFTLLLLRQDFLFGKGSTIYTFYSQSWVFILNILVVIIMFLGIIASRTKPFWKYIFILLFIGWFISKGSNPPLGLVFYATLFKMIPQTALLRNPYEKFGIVFVLAYTIFFAYGFSSLVKYFPAKFKKVCIIFIVIFSMFGITFPLWNGSLYRPIVIYPQSDYVRINNLLNKDKSDGRILVLPMIPGDSVHYYWMYRGLEPSEFLFDRPAISKTLRAEYYDTAYMSLYNEFILNKNYNKTLADFNIRYLLLHNDQDSKASGASASAQVREHLRHNTKVKLIINTGSLSLYKFISEIPSLFVVEGKVTPREFYKKIDNIHYKIYISNATIPYRLIFKETYNSRWNASIDNNIVATHALVYNYANEWNISRKGNYIINVVFRIYPWK